MKISTKFPLFSVSAAIALLIGVIPAKATLVIPQSFDFGTEAGKDAYEENFIETTRSSGTISVVPSGIHMTSAGNNHNAQASAEFAPLSTQNVSFEMSADIHFTEDYNPEARFARVGLMAFTQPNDDGGAIVNQGFGFLMFNSSDMPTPTQITFQNGLTGGARFETVTKNGLQRADLGGNTFNFHVVGDWNSAENEWTFTFTVTDPDSTTTTIFGTYNPDDVGSLPDPNLFTGNTFGFGGGAGGAGDPRFDFIVENFSIIPEPASSGLLALGLGLAAFLRARRRRSPSA